MITPHHPWYLLIKNIIDRLPESSIVADLGTSKQYAKEIAYYKDKLNKHHYFAMGYQPAHFGNETCHLSGDITRLPVLGKSIDLVLCIEVLEHVADPFSAIKEMYRVLKPGGKIILTTPFLTPYHGKSRGSLNYSHNSYPDYWRFTSEGLSYLFADFSKQTIYPATSTLGYYLEGVCKLPISTSIISKIPFLFTHKTPVTTTRHLVIAVK